MTPPRPFPPDVHRRRRERVLDALAGAAMVLPAAPSLVRGRDGLLPYRPDPELFHLTGWGEPDAVIVLRGFAEEARFVLFVPARDPEAERWDGRRRGPEEAGEEMGADEAHPLHELEDRLPPLLDSAEALHFRMEAQPTGVRKRCRRLVLEALERARARGARRGTGPRRVVDPGEILDDFRMLKEPGEVERLRHAADITVAAFREGLARVAPGRGEWEVQAALEAGFRRRGAPYPAFPTIVGSGPNGCILHYTENRRTMGSGDLVLVDGGAESDLYAADMTRTVPASGVFTSRQRELYDLVESARRRAVDKVAPGVRVDAVHQAALRELADGLVAMGVVEGSVDRVIAKRLYRPYFPHSTSHWLGMDVHDPGDYARSGRSRRLRSGMALTVEPGLYVPETGREDAEPTVPGALEGLEGTGIRIEDSVLVTEEGREVLTDSLPTGAEGVAGLVEGGGHG